MQSDYIVARSNEGVQFRAQVHGVFVGHPAPDRPDPGPDGRQR